MGRSAERIELARRALSSFEEVMRIENPSLIERDAAIQRFEFTFEAVWKAAKEVLYEREGIDSGSPKSVIRSCRETGILDTEQTAAALQMADDRNLSVHTYNEKLAAEIYSRLHAYQAVYSAWLSGLEGND
ncbi:HI0074 family nucleotidyltransferase substrate-binding subunit [Cohnella panacarvi]|uniref:HI0074 family nucleotidyltransferase substrate-binding subunit n=1 Tax=Cohnella panacarvi TaxID=400776 RepID=UPI00054FEA73|nr:HI0074 family nucleotidyltransferase substrate-binding subunit [Cohnella panacarvi]